MPVIRIDGALYHLKSNKTFAEDENRASHSHLYVMDQQTAEICRKQKNKNTNEPIIKIISKIINEENFYARSYQTLRDLEMKNNQNGELETLNYQLMITLSKEKDIRRYNRQ